MATIALSTDDSLTPPSVRSSLGFGVLDTHSFCHDDVPGVRSDCSIDPVDLIGKIVMSGSVRAVSSGNGSDTSSILSPIEYDVIIFRLTNSEPKKRTRSMMTTCYIPYGVRKKDGKHQSGTKQRKSTSNLGGDSMFCTHTK
jgi:hypothetical protein